MSAFTSANNDQIFWDDKDLLGHFPSSKKDVPERPQVKGNQYLINGEIRTFNKKSEDIATAIYVGGERVVLTQFGMCDKEVALEALSAAQKAWGKGLGKWPTATIQERVKAMHGFLEDFKAAKEDMAKLLMWDICKSEKDALEEVDRTIGELTLFIIIFD
jgi:glyceraldehyde-3-phosphate dehydrogenase (NADP+)